MSWCSIAIEKFISSPLSTDKLLRHLWAWGIYKAASDLQHHTQDICNHAVILVILTPLLFMSPWANIFCLAKVCLRLQNIFVKVHLSTWSRILLLLFYSCCFVVVVIIGKSCESTE